MSLSIDQIVAKTFGEGDHDVQAGHLNLLGKYLFNACCRDMANFEMQCCYMENDLDADGRRLVAKLAEFINLKE